MTIVCFNCGSNSPDFHFDCEHCESEVCTNCYERHLEDCEFIKRNKNNGA